MKQRNWYWIKVQKWRKKKFSFSSYLSSSKQRFLQISTYVYIFVLFRGIENWFLCLRSWTCFFLSYLCFLCPMIASKKNTNEGFKDSILIHVLFSSRWKRKLEKVKIVMRMKSKSHDTCVFVLHLKLF